MIVKSAPGESRTGSVLFVELGSEREFQPIVDIVRKLMPGFHVLGIRPVGSQVNSVYDEIIADEANLLRGNLRCRDGRNQFVRPELFVTLSDFIGRTFRTAGKISGRVRSSADSYSMILRHFLHLSSFWDNAISNNGIRAVVFKNPPHVFWDTSLYSVCKALKIPTLFFHSVPPFEDATYVYDDINQLGSIEFSRQIIEAADLNYILRPESALRAQKMQVQLSSSSIGMKLLSAQMENALSKQRILNLLRRRSGKSKALFKAIETRVLHLKYEYHRRKFQSEEALPEEYVLLELQPENNATTTIKGHMYGSQIEMISHVANSLPLGFKLVVKENIRQVKRLSNRQKHFWSDVAKVPRVHLCGDEVENEYLVDRCRAVIELGYSSLAMKSAMSGVPVVVLGLTHLKGISNIWTVSPEESLDSVLDSILNKDRSEIHMSQIDIEDSLTKWLLRTRESTLDGNLTRFRSSNDEEDKNLQSFNWNVAAVVATWLSLVVLN